MSKKKQTILDVLSEGDAPERRRTYVQVDAEGRVIDADAAGETVGNPRSRHAASESGRDAERANERLMRQRRRRLVRGDEEYEGEESEPTALRARRAAVPSAVTGYQLAETHVPGSSDASPAPLSPWDRTEAASTTGSAQVAEAGAASGAQVAGLAGVPTRVQDWMQRETRTSRGALAILGGVAVLLVWGAFQLGTRVARGQEAPELVSSAGLQEAGDPATTPGGPRAEHGTPGPETTAKAADGAGEGATPLRPESAKAGPESLEGQPATPAPNLAGRELDRQGLTIVTLDTGRPEYDRRCRALRDHLEALGFGTVEWIADEHSKKQIVGIRYHAGMSAEDRQELFARIRQLPDLATADVRMSFRTLERPVPYTVQD